MIQEITKPLQILSASAGSGKTYNLVLTYLRLILNEHEHSEVFSSIVAMTFTNKAASEMKSRIIDALNKLSATDSADLKANSFRQDISKALAIPEDKIQRRASLVLKQILHQYENFNVLTIDKFNLKLIRSFSRDLNINNDFQTTTNEKDILSQLVDQIYDDINTVDHTYLTNIALRLSAERFEDEGKWDFKKDLNEFISILLKEQNITIIQKVMQDDYSIERYTTLKNQLFALISSIENKAKELYSIASVYDMGKDFPGASTTAKAFEKLQNIFDSLSTNKYLGFFSPTLIANFEKDPKGKSFPDDVKKAGLSFVAFISENYTNYLRLKLFVDQYFFIAILKIVADELNQFKRLENVILISEFNQLIADLLKDEHAPYIYERIGNRYKHFLLDEFQDTSRLQWMNLIPLVHESLGKGQANLIVGDPKQSIYRFKNGLAEQFVALPKIYNPECDPRLAESSAFFDLMGESKPLKDNWRSKAEIVTFNNSFFEILSEQNPAIIQDFYKDITQIPKGEKGAYIYVESAISQKGNSTAEEEVEEQNEDDSETAFPFLYDWIESCVKDGFNYGDICILDYKKSNCNSYARYLVGKGLTVVSVDSLLLGADKKVKFLVQFIRWRNKPASEIEARKFSEMFVDLKSLDPVAELKKYWVKKETETFSKTFFDSKAFILENFVALDNFFFYYENLYQLLQKAYELFGLQEFGSAYLHQFSDYAFQFDQRYGPNLDLFLEMFENDGKNTPVVIPENKDAIKIMTGHKSKGLEFPVVLVPSLCWEITNSQSKFLIDDGEYVYYTPLSKSSKIEAVRSKFEQEFNQASLDKINLLYVIFTRAESRLYVRNVNDSGRKSTGFQKMVHEVLKTLVSDSSDAFIHEIGEKLPKQKHDEKNKLEDGKFFPQAQIDNLWFPDISLQDRAVLDQDAVSEQRRYGNQLHSLLALCEHEHEIDKLVDAQILKGNVELEFQTKLKNQLRAILSHPEFISLFYQVEHVLREQAIILDKDESKRPDLILLKSEETIVVDYKSGLEDEKHINQVDGYCKVLREMGYKKVSGVVFYTNQLNIVKC